MSVKQIGTEKAEYSTVKAGADDHIRWIAQGYDSKTEDIQKELDLTVARKMQFDEDYNNLHVDIANQTFAQEKITKKIDYLENQIGETKNKEEKANIVKEMKDLEETVKKADERIKAIFQEQDVAQQQANECEAKIGGLTEEIKVIEQEKNKIISRLEREDPIPELKATKKVYTGTRITGTQASMILKQDMGAYKFNEIDSQSGDNEKQLIHQTINL